MSLPPLALAALDIQSLFATRPDGTQHAPALDNVSLNVQPGEFVTVIGPADCGMGTLLRVLADLNPVDSGVVRLHGLSPAEARRAHRVNGIFGAPALLDWRNVRDNIALPLEIRGLAPDAIEQQVQSVLARFGLVNLAAARPQELRPGEAQQVALARALVSAPPLLLLDDALGALDPLTRDRLNEQWLRLWERDRPTVVMTTRSVPEAVFMASRIVVLSASPSRVVDVIETEWPLGRRLDMRDSAEFNDMAHRVHSALQDNRG